MSLAERLDRIKSTRRTVSGWRPDAGGKSHRKRTFVLVTSRADWDRRFGHLPPDPLLVYDGDGLYEKETGHFDGTQSREVCKPFLMRQMAPVSLDGKSELTCRSQVRAFELANGVERTGLEWTGDEKPKWFDEYKANRREREKRAKQGKKTPAIKKVKA